LQTHPLSRNSCLLVLSICRLCTLFLYHLSICMCRIVSSNGRCNRIEIAS
jgi:hypothetical protein